MLRTTVLALAFFLSSFTAIAVEGATPVGVWLHPNGRIQMKVSPCGIEFCAKLVWFKFPNDAEGKPLTDVNNSDPALRSRPLLGLQVLHGLRPSGDGTWENGKVYNPDDGDDYGARMSMQEDGTLRVRGYILDPIFGETMIWTRVK